MRLAARLPGAARRARPPALRSTDAAARGAGRRGDVGRGQPRRPVRGVRPRCARRRAAAKRQIGAGAGRLPVERIGRQHCRELLRAQEARARHAHARARRHDDARLPDFFRRLPRGGRPAHRPLRLLAPDEPLPLDQSGLGRLVAARDPGRAAAGQGHPDGCRAARSGRRQSRPDRQHHAVQQRAPLCAHQSHIGSLPATTFSPISRPRWRARENPRRFPRSCASAGTPCCP